MAQNSESNLFSYKYPTGRTSRYRVSVRGTVNVETPMGPQISPIQIEMLIDQRVLGIDGNTETVALKIEAAQVLQGTETAPLPEEGTTSVFQLDPRGNMEIISGAGTELGFEKSQMIFPEHSLKKGESWVQTTSSSAPTPILMRTKYTFSGYENLKGKQLAIFESELMTDSQGSKSSEAKAQSKGKSFFDNELGLVIKTVADTAFSFQVPVDPKTGKFATTHTHIHTEMTLEEK